MYKLFICYTRQPKLNIYIYKMEKLLGKIYYDPKEGFMGINNLYRKAKKKDKTIKMKEVEKWLKQQAVGQVHTRKSDQIEYLPIMSFTPGHFQMDLTDMDVFKSQNKNFRYILTVINVNTRKLYAYKSKKKDAASITLLLKPFLERHHSSYLINWCKCSR